MADKSLTFKVAVDTAEVTSGLRVATQSVESGTQTIRRALADTGTGFANLGHSIREFSAEERSQGRLANFMATQVAELGLASKGAAAEVAQFVSAFAFGGGIGVAAEGVKFIVKAFAELGAEETQARDELKKYIDDLSHGTADIKSRVEEMLAAMNGASRAQLMASKDLKPLLVEQRKLEEEIATAEGNMVAARDELAVSEADAFAKTNVHDQVELDSMRKKLQGLKEQIAERQKLIGSVATADIHKEEAEDAKKSLEEQKKIQDDWNQYRQQSFQKDQDDWTKHLVDQEKAEQEHLIRLSKAELESRKAIDKMLADQDKVKLDRQLAIQAAEDAEQQKRAQTAKRVADQIAASATASLRAVVDGSQSAGEAIKGLFENVAFEVIGALIRLAAESIAAAIAGAAVARTAAISTTQGHIAEAVSGAAASQAFIPFIGPGLAAAAAGTMLGSLEGLTAPLLSSKGGLDRVPFDGMGAILHKDETVLSAPYAKGLRKIIAGQQQGASGDGGALHLHFPNALFVDRASLAKLAQDPHFLRGMREAKRNGLT